MNIYYRMPEGGGAAIGIEDPSTASYWNSQGYGIFWTIHEFNGERKKENLTHLNGFAIDIDGGNKEQTLSEIKRCRLGLHPTRIMETKNGFHLYWLFKKPIETSYDEELERDYKSVILHRLVPFYKADPKASDLCRLLRVPFFLHQKDPTDPFLIKPIWDNPVTYTWGQIERFYPNQEALKRSNVQDALVTRELKLGVKGRDLLEKIWNLDCEQALLRLSGRPCVLGELFSFKKVASGNLTIIVNGKPTSCWIDHDKRIGSFDKGGPTIWQWLYWYCRDHKQVYSTIKEVFPEL